MAKITVLVDSQRKGGNTDLLATAFCEGARQKNEVTMLSVAELAVNPCSGCNACRNLGLLLVAADTIPQVFDSIKMQYQLVLGYFNLESIGKICVGGVEEKGSIRENKALEQARELGRTAQ